MKKKLTSMLVSLISLLFCSNVFMVTVPLSAIPLEKKDLAEIIREVEKKYIGDSAKGSMEMKIVTRNYTRKMSMQYWSKGKDRFLVRILSPAKDRGISTLKLRKNI